MLKLLADENVECSQEGELEGQIQYLLKWSL